MPQHASPHVGSLKSTNVATGKPDNVNWLAGNFQETHHSIIETDSEYLTRSEADTYHRKALGPALKRQGISIKTKSLVKKTEP